MCIITGLQEDLEGEALVSMVYCTAFSTLAIDQIQPNHVEPKNLGAPLSTIDDAFCLSQFNRVMA